MYYTYKDGEEEYIAGFRNILELMINKGYGWANADGNVGHITRPIIIIIMYSDALSELQGFAHTVSFAYDNGRTDGYLYPLEEVKRDYFWQWLEAKGYLIRPRKNIGEHVLSVKDKTIGEVAKYVRENVLIRNVKLFQ